jgi:imidazolonepropionase-like amidohydrolase
MPKATLIKNVRIIDGISGTPIEGKAVLVVGERIEGIGTENELVDRFDIPATPDIVDGGGRTLIPGLINAHEHLTWRRTPGSWTDRVVSRSPSWFIARGAGHSLLSIKEGVTTVRDVGAKDDSALVLRDAIEAGILVGPRILSCRQTISMTGGHAYETSVVADGADGVRQAVREQILLGADFIKLMASGGAVAKNRDFPWSPQFTDEEMRAAFEEAHRQERLTTVHCHPASQIRAAVKAGADCIEHGALIDEPTAAFLAERKIPLVPTLAAKESFLVHGEQYGRDSESIEKIRRDRPATIDKWRKIRETGVRLIAGVDSLGDLNLELALFVEIGMTPHQAIISATSHAAEAIGMKDHVGGLEAGKFADMVLVNGDPLQNIDHLKDIAWIMKGGRRFDPATLTSAMGELISQPV